MIIFCPHVGRNLGSTRLSKHEGIRKEGFSEENVAQKTYSNPEESKSKKYLYLRLKTI